MVDYEKIIHCMEGAAIGHAISIIWGALLIFGFQSPTAWFYSSLVLLVIPISGKFITQHRRTRKAIKEAKEASKAFVIDADESS